MSVTLGSEVKPKFLLFAEIDEGKDVSGQRGTGTGHQNDEFKRLRQVACFI